MSRKAKSAAAIRNGESGVNLRSAASALVVFNENAKATDSQDPYILSGTGETDVILHNVPGGTFLNLAVMYAVNDSDSSAVDDDLTTDPIVRVFGRLPSNSGGAKESPADHSLLATPDGSYWVPLQAVPASATPVYLATLDTSITLVQMTSDSDTYKMSGYHQFFLEGSEAVMVGVTTAAVGAPTAVKIVGWFSA